MAKSPCGGHARNMRHMLRVKPPTLGHSNLYTNRIETFFFFFFSQELSALSLPCTTRSTLL